MMRALTAILLASVSLPALADVPPPSPAVPDTHIRQVAYSATKRTDIIGVVGQPTTITFPKGESVYRVIQTEVPDETGDPQAPWRGPSPAEVKDNPLGNNLPLWPVRPGVSMMTIVTSTSDGSQKVYPFRLLARAAEAGAADAQGVILNLMFTGSSPVSQPQAAAIYARVAHARSETEQRAKAEQIRLDAFNASASDCHYHAHGNKTTDIAPRCPMDNGEWTLMRFAGLSRKPAVYILSADGSERLARQHGDTDFVVVEEIAQAFRLRLGSEVLDVINDAYDPVGKPAGTGTVSPGIVRDVIQASANSK
jgi:type IV secretory pathway VirB9-like protein